MLRTEWDRHFALINKSPLQRWLRTHRQQWKSGLSKSFNKADVNAFASVDKLPSTPEVLTTWLATLKPLRLCCTKLATTAAEVLFEEVLLHFTAESHEKLELTSHHPVCKTYVRKLRIVPKAIFGPVARKEHFGRWLDVRWTRPLGDEPITYAAHAQNFGGFGLPVGLKRSRKAIDFHYREYSCSAPNSRSSSTRRRISYKPPLVVCRSSSGSNLVCTGTGIAGGKTFYLLALNQGLAGIGIVIGWICRQNMT